MAETSHRHANEFASALAALRILRAKLGRAEPMLDDAIASLEGNVRLERLLLSPGTGDVTELLLELSQLIAATRPGRPRFRLRILGVGSMDRTDDARLFLRAAYELMANAAKHHHHGGGAIDVVLVTRWSEMRLLVSNRVGMDEGRRCGPPSGLLVLRSLVAQARGRIRWRRRGRRFLAMATFPLAQPAEGDREARTAAR